MPGAATIEIHPITVMAFRDNDGHPTCCADWALRRCQFIGTRVLASGHRAEVCMPMGRDIPRKAYGGIGNTYDAGELLRPVDGCPVWEGHES